MPKIDNHVSREEFEQLFSKKKKGKYRSEKTIIDDISFDSKKEAKRYCELKALEKTGEISELQRQVRYTLIPSQKDESGKTIERPCQYVADFVYKSNDGQTVVEDTKGIRTTAYIIKRKLMLERFGIRITEI